MKKQYNKAKYIRTQRLVNLRMAKAYRTISHEALFILTGILPINIRATEAAALYNIKTGINIEKYQIHKEENPRNWLHPADTVKVNDIAAETTDDREDSKHNIHVYTDGSKR